MNEQALRPMAAPDAGLTLRALPEAGARPEPIGVPLGEAFAVLRRRAWTVVLTIAIGVGLAAIVLQQMPPRYTAEASLLIEPQRTQVSDLQAVTPEPADTGALMRTQIDILGSPGLSLRVVRALNLTKIPEFMPGTGGFRASITNWLRSMGVLPASDSSAKLTTLQREEIARDALANSISFGNEVRSNVLRVMVTTGNARLSARIANEITHQYLNFKRQEKFDVMQQVHDWFQSQLTTMAEEVRKSDDAVEAYRKKHGLMDVPHDNGGEIAPSIARQQLSEISQRLVQSRAELGQKEAQLAQAEAAMKRGRPEALPEVVVSEMITQLVAQEAMISGREAQLAATQGHRNPELLALRAQRQNLQDRVMQEMGNIVGSLKAAVDATRTQVRELNQQLTEQRSAVGVENSAELGLQGLLARARANRTVYESFLNRATQLANVAGIQEANAGLLSPATAPLAPSAPRRVRLLVAAAVLLGVLGVALAFLQERLTRGFRSPEELETSLCLNPIGLVPRVSRRSLRAMQAGGGPPEAIASLDKLRGRFHIFDSDRRPRVVLVTSALPREGKSAFTSSFAANAARAGWRVLLMECDFRRPSIAASLGLSTAGGLFQILKQGAGGDVATMIRRTAVGVDVIPAGRGSGDPQELLNNGRMSKLLAAARTNYDLVLIDTPPVLPVPDALLLARHADATILVVRSERTPRKAVYYAIRLLAESGAKFAGTVMTHVNLRTVARSGYGMAYFYTNYVRSPSA